MFVGRAFRNVFGAFGRGLVASGRALAGAGRAINGALAMAGPRRGFVRIPFFGRSKTPVPAPKVHFTGPNWPPAKFRPNSAYTKVISGNKARQTAIYDENGDVIYHIDWVTHDKYGPGHGHNMTIPGNPLSGHGGKHEWPWEVPPEYSKLPPGIFPFE